MGDLLRIDLTTGTVDEETIAPEMIREYIGGKGIGTHLLLDEVAPDVDPLSPQNKLFFVTGPISGTKMFGGNRFGVHFLSPLTGGYGECTCGGNLAPQFAKTGYKIVVVEGAADDAGVPRDLRERSHHPPGRRHLGPRRLRGGGRDQGAGRGRQGPGVRHRPRRREPRPLRLRRPQQVAPARAAAAPAP